MRLTRRLWQHACEVSPPLGLVHKQRAIRPSRHEVAATAGQGSQLGVSRGVKQWPEANGRVTLLMLGVSLHRQEQ